MFIDRRSNTDVVVVTDYRNKSDGELDEFGRDRKACHVLASNPEIPPTLTRIALFDYKDKTDAELRVMRREDLKRALSQLGTRVVIVLPTVALDADDKADNACWHTFGAPSSLEDMRGTFFQVADSFYVLPIHGLSPWSKQLQRWQNVRWISWAMDVAAGKREMLTTRDRINIHPTFYTFEIRPLDSESMLAVDIETIEGSDKILAIGIAGRNWAISCPTDEYTPYGYSAVEPAGEPLMLRSLAWLLSSSIPKVFHNYTFDVPRLQERGFPVGGPIHDTFCAMAIAYPELRHGLQHSVANFHCIPPWKSEWHPKLKGITREDPEFWSCDPIGLRRYNAQDAFYTWHLAASVLPQVGIDLT